MLITRHQRRYLLIYQSLLPFLINPIVCLLIGWWDYRAMQALPVWGVPKSMSVDLLATSFLLPFITCLIASPLIRRDLRNDVVEKIPIDHNSPWLLRFYKRPVFLRALMCGLSGSIVVGSMVLVLLNLLSFKEVPVSDFMPGKLLFAAIYGAIATPLIAILVLSNQSESLVRDEKSAS